MDAKTYLTESEKTNNPNTLQTILDALEQEPNMADIAHAILGVETEGGEMGDALKKRLIYGKPLDRTNLKEEIGDVLWYLALLCRALDYDLEDAMAVNIAKLKARYPNKFTSADALNRNLERERSVLEMDPGVPQIKAEVKKG